MTWELQNSYKIFNNIDCFTFIIITKAVWGYIYFQKKNNAFQTLIIESNLSSAHFPLVDNDLSLVESDEGDSFPDLLKTSTLSKLRDPVLCVCTKPISRIACFIYRLTQIYIYGWGEYHLVVEWNAMPGWWSVFATPPSFGYTRRLMSLITNGWGNVIKQCAAASWTTSDEQQRVGALSSHAMGRWCHL